MACGLFRHFFCALSGKRSLQVHQIHQMESLNFPGLMSTVKRSSLNVHHDVMICDFSDGLSIFSFLALQRWVKRQDLIDQHVAYFLRKNPEVGSHGVRDDGTNPQDGVMQQKSGDRPGCRT